MKRQDILRFLFCALVVLCPFDAIAEQTYAHQLISDWLFKPKVWTNSKMQVLWSEGPLYNSLVLYNRQPRLLTDNCKNGSASLNERGQVAWIDTDGQVYLFNGRVIQKISPESARAWNLNINKKGQVVWDANDETEGRHIYFYNGRNTVKLTSSGVNGQPQISKRGQVAWIHADLAGVTPSDFEVHYFNRRDVLQLTSNEVEDDFIRMSKNGKLMWLSFTPTDTEAFYYNGRNVFQLTDNDYNETSPVISPKGKPFWTGWDGEDFELFTIQSGGVWQITDNDYEDGYPHVNKRGQFAWIGWAGTVWPWEVFYFDGYNIQRLTENETFDMNPLVSDNGLVVWTHYTGPYNQSGELHLYDEGNVMAITSGMPVNLSDIPKEINVKGEILYVEMNRDTDEERIFLAIPD